MGKFGSREEGSQQRVRAVYKTGNCWTGTLSVYIKHTLSIRPNLHPLTVSFYTAVHIWAVLLLFSGKITARKKIKGLMMHVCCSGTKCDLSYASVGG